MLRCGRDWQPVRIDRVIENFPTSTRVAKVATDAGIGFLKGMDNPAGNESLAMELVGTELAAELGLVVPPFAVVDVAEIEIPRLDCEPVPFGPAFVSRELRGSPSDGGDTFLRKLTQPDHVALIVVFDTWVRNIDRCPPVDYFDPEPRRDNLLFTPVGRKFDLIAFDHTNCFVEEDLETGLQGPHFVEDERIYGLFPEFAPYLGERSITRAVAALRRIDPAVIREIVHSVPREWGPSKLVRDLWAARISERAARVADIVPDRLVCQMNLGL